MCVCVCDGVCVCMCGSLPYLVLSRVLPAVPIDRYTGGKHCLLGVLVRENHKLY